MFNDFEIISPGSTGLVHEEQLDPRDYVLGAISKEGVVRDRPVIKKDGHGWADDQPVFDYQRVLDGDTNGCVSFSTVNAIQYSVNNLIKNSPFSFDYLNQNDYITSGIEDISKGSFEANNRIVVVGSGTDPNAGNSVTAVAEFIRKNGLSPKSAWPWDNQMTKSNFYNGGVVPKEVLVTGQEFLKLLTIEHEWVSGSVFYNSNLCTPQELISALKYGTPTVSVDGRYERDADGLITSAQLEAGKQGKQYFWNHRITLRDFKEGVYWECHDHYTNQIVKFRWDYPFGNPKLYFITLKNMPQLYKKKLHPAIYAKHWSQDLLIPFGDGEITGGDLFKSLYGVEKYSDVPRLDVDELPYPVASYAFKTVI